MNALLTRNVSSPFVTMGTFEHKDFSCVTMEPPWVDNEPNKSCIPEGAYDCHWHKSPRYMWVYTLLGVPGRSRILIHPGNLASHTKGCILPGKRTGVLHGEPAVLVSRVATRQLFNHMDREPFTLEVRYA